MNDQVKSIEKTSRPTGPFYICEDCDESCNVHPSNHIVWSEQMEKWLCSDCWDDSHWQVEKDAPEINDALSLEDYLAEGGAVDAD